MRSKNILAIILGLRVVHTLNASPFGAGTCQAGRAVGSPHGENGSGSLEDGGYELLLNNNVLSTGSHVRIPSSKNHTLVLRSCDVFFRGFLFRLSGTNGEDASGLLQLNSETVKIAQVMNSTSEVAFSSVATCDVGVLGITHRDRSDKTEVGLIISTPMDGSEFQLEVTVVQENSGVNRNFWFYSSVLLSVSDQYKIQASKNPFHDLSSLPENSHSKSTLPVFELSTFPSVFQKPSAPTSKANFRSPSSGPTDTHVPSGVLLYMPSKSPTFSKQPSVPPFNFPPASPITSQLSSAPPFEIPSTSSSMSQLTATPPSFSPSHEPSVSHLPSSSTLPSLSPTVSKQPSVPPSNFPSASPTTSQLPSVPPSEVPSTSPSTSKLPTTFPSFSPSHGPSVSHSPSSSTLPSNMPTVSAAPTRSPITFYVMGDVPYDDEELAALPQQLADIPSDAQFVVHVGDINRPLVYNCSEQIFSNVSQILSKSAYPLFIVRGDNDWIDCPNPAEAWRLWDEYFGLFDDNWNIPFHVTRQTTRNEHFAFLLDEVLFIGLNLNRLWVHSRDELRARVMDASDWVIGKMAEFRGRMTTLVLFGHDKLRGRYHDLLNPLAEEIKSLGIPAVYIHGNGHHWKMNENFIDSQMLRVQVDRGGIAPPLKVTIHRDGIIPFEFDRRLPPQLPSSLPSLIPSETLYPSLLHQFEGSANEATVSAFNRT